MSAATARRDCYAVVAPGLESLAAAELRALGMVPGDAEPGGVPFLANDAELFTANLYLRTVSRVLVRLVSFRVTAFHELERLARGVPWDAFVMPGGMVRLRVSCRKSRLYHSDGVAERIAGAIVRRVSGVVIEGVKSEAVDGPDDAGETGDAEAGAGQLFVVRLFHDLCTISADSSGALLHRRGYRKAVAKAPLRETLAAAMVLGMEWKGTTPLMDPMCGSGTIAIEAALLARRIAPGMGRSFACERWPDVSAAVCTAIRDAACDAVLDCVPAPILASDRDAGAVAAARANAERAHVLADVEITERAVSAIDPPAMAGMVLINPPYGDRVGDPGALRNLYAQLGNVVRAKCAGWTVGLLSADRVLEGQTRLAFQEVLRFRNGGIPVRLVRASAPGPSR